MITTFSHALDFLRNYVSSETASTGEMSTMLMSRRKQTSEVFLRKINSNNTEPKVSKDY